MAKKQDTPGQPTVSDSSTSPAFLIGPDGSRIASTEQDRSRIAEPYESTRKGYPISHHPADQDRGQGGRFKLIDGGSHVMAHETDADADGKPIEVTVHLGDTIECSYDMEKEFPGKFKRVDLPDNVRRSNR